MEDEKPFACTFAGCSMRFTNEDHLTVHKKKHDMVLNLGSTQKANVFIADQTPTPTRFIRNCEEVGLFQDLQNVNPFEETFRKAVEGSRGPHLEVDSLHLPVATDDTLHTPHVFPAMEDANSISDLISSTSVIDEHQASSKELAKEEFHVLLHPSSPSPSTVQATHTEEEVHENDGGATDAGTPPRMSTTVVEPSSRIVVRQEADTSQQRGRPPRTASADSGSSSLPATTGSPAQQAQQAEGSTIKVLLRMPDGRVVQLSGVSMDNGPTTHIPLQRLKQQIMTSKRKESAASDVDAKALVKVKKVAVAQRIVREPSFDSSDLSPQRNDSDEKEGGEGDTDEQKRRRFRERNRVAAMKCRQKRKHWVLELERRAEASQRANAQLQLEVAKLRQEAMQLKAMLLAHKDCSVTRAMQLQGGDVGLAQLEIADAMLMVEVAGPAQKQSGPKVIKPNPNAAQHSASMEVAAQTLTFPPRTHRPKSLKQRRQAAASLAVTTSPAAPSQAGHQVSEQQTGKQPLQQQVSVVEEVVIPDVMDLSANAVASLQESDTDIKVPAGCIICITNPENNQQIFTVKAEQGIANCIIQDGKIIPDLSGAVDAQVIEVIKPNSVKDECEESDSDIEVLVEVPAKRERT